MENGQQIKEKVKEEEIALKLEAEKFILKVEGMLLILIYLFFKIVTWPINYYPFKNSNSNLFIRDEVRAGAEGRRG
jgi:hypothetical protein